MDVEVDPWTVVASRVRSEGSGSSPDVWATVGERLDPGRYRPALAGDIELKTFPLRRGGHYVMAANPRDRIYYRLEPSEAALLPLMDGSRSVSEIVVERLQSGGDLDLAEVTDLVQALRTGNFLVERYVDAGSVLSDALQRPRSRLRATASTFVRTLSIEWPGAERMVVWLHRHGLRAMFHPLGKLLAALLAVVGGAAFLSVVRSSRFELTPQSVGTGFVVLLALDFFIVFLHELGHASLLVHYGRRVNGAGFRIYFGTPAFFIESSDALMLDPRRRIAQAFAGPYFEMVAAGIASLALWLWPEAALAPTLYRFTVLNYFILFLNLIPLLELDGYWILADALQMPDLRPRSLAFLRHELWHKLRHRKRFSRGDLGLGLYGFVGVAFTILCLYSAFFFWRRTFGGLVTKMWNAGPVGIVLFAVLGIFLAGPVLRAVGQLLRSVGRETARQWRRLRFRAQRRWRVEAVRLLDSQPQFDDLPVEVLNELAGRVRLRDVGRGTVVIRQGDRPDAYYVVRRGGLEVVEHDDAVGYERLLRRVGPGESFGDVGLATGAARNATVRTTTPAELVVVDKGTFDRLLAERTRLAETSPTLQAVIELRALPAFAHLGQAELADLVSLGRWDNRAPDEEVVRQGEAGDTFYVVSSGRLEVVQDGRTVRELVAGDHFGEIALLTRL